MSHWVVQFDSSAIMHRDAWLMARGLRTTLPRAYAMMGRMAGHTYIENTLPSLSLAFVAEKAKTRRMNWSADQVFWQADHLFWSSPPRVVGRWSPLSIAWSAAFPQLPWVEFHFSGASCNFLKSIANKGESRHRDGFPDKATRACMHPYHSEQSWGSPFHVACMLIYLLP